MKTFPKFRAVREDRILKAGIRRGLEAMSLREAFDELETEELEKEIELKSFDAETNETDEEMRRDLEFSRDLDHEAEAARQVGSFYDDDDCDWGDLREI